MLGTLNYFDLQNEKKRKEEGEVIEKEAEGTEGNRSEQEDGEVSEEEE